MFKYRLATLLRYRKSLEERQQRELATANREYMAEMQNIKNTEIHRHKTMDWMKEMRETGIDPRYLPVYDKFMNGLEADILTGVVRSHQAALKLDVEREKLMETVKKRRTIELHRDRQKERHEEEEERRERRQDDEMSMARYILKGGKNVTQ